MSTTPHKIQKSHACPNRRECPKQPATIRNITKISPMSQATERCPNRPKCPSQPGAYSLSKNNQIKSIAPVPTSTSQSNRPISSSNKKNSYPMSRQFQTSNQSVIATCPKCPRRLNHPYLCSQSVNIHHTSGTTITSTITHREQRVSMDIQK